MSTNIDSILRQQNESGISQQTQFMQTVYAWMSGGLMLTAIVAFFTLTIEEVAFAAYRFSTMLFLAELGLVWWLSASVYTMSATKARVLFLLYSALNGLTLALVLYRYTGDSVTNVFLSSALMYGIVSAYGYMTKRDLTTIGSFFAMGLIGLVVAMLVNMFLQSSALGFAISFIGVLVFVGLTAYDTQKIKESYSLVQDDGSVVTNHAIIGALVLYLDFINLFLFLLRLFGRKR